MKIIAKPSSRTTRGKNLTLVWGSHPFPVGKIMVAMSADGLCWLGLNCDEKRLKKEWPGAELVEDGEMTAKIAKDIAKLWPHKLDDLSVPLVLYGTPFQLKVWKALLKIKSGATTTYGQLAEKLGDPKASRAVGSAVGKNPISIVVPCHRVVNKAKGITNYAWGPAIKLALLKGEQWTGGKNQK